MNNSFDFNENFKESIVNENTLKKILMNLKIFGSDKKEIINEILSYCKEKSNGKNNVAVQDLI